MIELPASSLLKLNTSVSYPYTVVHQEDKTITLYPTDLIEGQILEFKEGLYGLSISSSVVLLNQIPSVQLSKAKILDLFKLKIPQTQVLVDLTLVGSLKVKCQVSEEIEPGLLGWGLEGPDGLIALGNDYIEATFASFEGKGVFPPGQYTLRVTRYINPGLQPLATIERTWELTESTHLISAGDYYDNSPPLLL